MVCQWSGSSTVVVIEELSQNFTGDSVSQSRWQHLRNHAPHQRGVTVVEVLHCHLRMGSRGRYHELDYYPFQLHPNGSR